jgi:hypothetical protein
VEEPDPFASDLPDIDLEEDYKQLNDKNKQIVKEI